MWHYGYFKIDTSPLCSSCQDERICHYVAIIYMLDTRGEQSLVSLFSFGGTEVQFVKIKNNVRK